MAFQEHFIIVQELIFFAFICRQEDLAFYWQDEVLKAIQTMLVFEGQLKFNRFISPEILGLERSSAELRVDHRPHPIEISPAGFHISLGNFA